ncbi:Uma2 family endonuclease [Streptomyces monomycini]|uniref:Uma2 family endonuclease n=1 Tax=Streptomyces monomycini TaxID=371720 RepID=UPI00067CAD99|nr:Uma2 family endonuclease [Streptomyces monomycini]
MTLMHHDTVEDIMRGEKGHELLRFLEKIPELDQLKIELIDGKIVMQASAAPFHNRIVALLTAQVLAEGWEALPEQALVSDISSFEPKADLTVTVEEAIRSNPNPLPADRVDLVVEVVSSDRDSDYIKKRMWYAMSRIPLYLLVDPNECMIELYSEPDHLTYRRVDPYQFGDQVPLPEPFSFAIDTSRFKPYPPKLP